MKEWLKIVKYELLKWYKENPNNKYKCQQAYHYVLTALYYGNKIKKQTFEDLSKEFDKEIDL